MLNRLYSISVVTFLLLSNSIYAQQTSSTVPSNVTVSSGNYIVVLKPNATEDIVQGHLNWMSQHLTANQSHHSVHTSHLQQQNLRSSLNYSSIGGFRWYSGNFHTEAVDSLSSGSAQDAVHYVVEDIILNTQELVQQNAPSWGIDRIDQRRGTDGEYRFPSSQGLDVTVYIVDTGMDISHSDIVGRASYGPSFIGNTSDPTDSNGHGTFVAGVCCGTRYGVAKESNIVSVKALNSDGDGQLSNVLRALSWIVEQHQNDTNAKSVVKYVFSTVSTTFIAYPYCLLTYFASLSLGAKYNQATNEAVEQAISLGIHFAVAGK